MQKLDKIGLTGDPKATPSVYKYYCTDHKKILVLFKNFTWNCGFNI